MDEDEFWAIIEQSRAASDEDLGEQAERLEELLSELTVEQVVAFDAGFVEASRQLYTWEHWGAAEVILGWTSDDTFTDFRSWVIAQGRVTFEQFRADPDSIVTAGFDDQEELSAAEQFGATAADVYSELTGKDLSEALPDREIVEFQEQPAGVRFETGDAVLAERYPRLATEYLHRPDRLT